MLIPAVDRQYRTENRRRPQREEVHSRQAGFVLLMLGSCLTELQIDTLKVAMSEELQRAKKVFSSFLQPFVDRLYKMKVSYTQVC